MRSWLWNGSLEPPRRGTRWPINEPSAGSAESADFQFRGFDPRGELQIKRRHLPHWKQEGATYFVTFRLTDSVPESVLSQWSDERKNWLRYHPQPWDWKTAREASEKNGKLVDKVESVYMNPTDYSPMK